ncbi:MULTISPECIES: 50S ribosomal protein L5 [unclassified Mycoplasma]|uniref:50S ribosomal protein L5 n=1 Tax=unclassified Mycoplasma TaxID=2683645 RepID=UPI000FDE4CC2
MNNLRQQYHEKVKPDLQAQFNYSSPMQIPRLSKLVLNMGVGHEIANSKAVDEVVEQLTLISGQKPVLTLAKKSLASWKLREGMPVGAKVTLRGDKMWNFLQKMIDIVIPRIRDFRGLSPQSFDSQGNYAFGVSEQIIFPEIDFDKVRKIKGLDVIIVTTASDQKEALALLTLLGLPFKKGRS